MIRRQRERQELDDSKAREWRRKYVTPQPQILFLQLTDEERDAARDAYQTLAACAKVENHDGINSAQLIDRITLAINQVRWRHAHENLAWESDQQPKGT